MKTLEKLKPGDIVWCRETEFPNPIGVKCIVQEFEEDDDETLVLAAVKDCDENGKMIEGSSPKYFCIGDSWCCDNIEGQYCDEVYFLYTDKQLAINRVREEIKNLRQLLENIE